MRKKGITGFEIIVILIILVLTLVLVFVFLNRYKTATVEAEWKSSCKASVYAYATQQGILNFKSGRTDIICPIRKEPVVIDWSLDDEAGQTKAKQEIADKLENCWSVYGGGKYDLFNQKQSGRFCAVCHIFKFEGGARDKEIPGLYEFMLKEKVPGKKETYFDFMNGQGTLRAAEVLRGLNPVDLRNQKFETDKDHATIFFYVRGVDEIQRFYNNLLAHSVSAFVFASPYPWSPAPGLTKLGLQLAGILPKEKQEWMAYVYFLPYEKGTLQNLSCELASTAKIR